MTMAIGSSYDYIIVGGGTAGCVLASRLLQRQSSLLILVIEAGSDVSNHPHVSKPQEAALLHFSDIDYKYFTVPQKNLDNNPRYVCGVKALSGAVTINAGTTILYALLLSYFASGNLNG
jgi:choline dehydrogenase-like flavoprotein